jgi:hypothetical protein
MKMITKRVIKTIRKGLMKTITKRVMKTIRRGK